MTEITDSLSTRPATDIERAFHELDHKAKPYSELWAYYDGDQPVPYTADRLNELFKGLRKSEFTQNWCGVTVKAELDRMRLQGFTVEGNPTAEKRASELFAALNLALESKDVHEASLVTGEAFVIVGQSSGADIEAGETEDDQGHGEEGEIEVYFNDPRTVHAFYYDENPNKIRMAAKWWRDSTKGSTHILLYYADRIEEWVSTGNVSAQSASSFVLTETNPNAYGLVPVFHFRPERRVVKSALRDVVPLQNGVNKLLADMMIAAEFGAFMQRWVISNGDPSTMLSSPFETWVIPAGDKESQPAAVGQFAPTPLANYTEAIANLVQSIGVITRTPKHYFQTQGGDPSGEALIAMEAPLNAKTTDHIASFSVTWARLMAFVLVLEGAEVDPVDVTPRFAPVMTVQPSTRSQIRKTNKESGIPLEVTLLEEGKQQSEVDEILAIRDKESKASQSSLASALLAQQRQFNQGDNPGNPPPTENEEDEQP